MPVPGGSASENLVRGPAPGPIHLRVNGRAYQVIAPPSRTLLDALRDDIGLTGTKKACDMGNCGACTVIRDGRAVYSCLSLAVECEDGEILTVEGLIAPGGELHPIQQAVVESDGLQCGFCTPGQVMAIKSLLDRNPDPTPDEVRRGLAGNLCRCGAYPGLQQAALEAAAALRRDEQSYDEIAT